MSTLLTVGVISAVSGSDEDRGISFRRVVEVQAAIRREHFPARDLCGRKRGGIPGFKRSLRSKTTGPKKKRRRGQSEKITKLATCNLRLFVTFIRKLRLVRSGGRAHVIFVLHHTLDCLIKILHNLRFGSTLDSKRKQFEITPKALASFSPGLERSNNPGFSRLKSY